MLQLSVSNFLQTHKKPHAGSWPSATGCRMRVIEASRLIISLAARPAIAGKNFIYRANNGKKQMSASIRSHLLMPAMSRMLI